MRIETAVCKVTNHLCFKRLVLIHTAVFLTVSLMNIVSPVLLYCASNETNNQSDISSLLNKGRMRINAFLNAAKEGNVDELERLLESGLFVDVRDRGGNTALIMAAQKNQVKAVEFLVSKGANVNAEGFGTALTWSSQNGYADIVRILVANKANVNRKTKTGTTPILAASVHGHVEIGKILADNGADLNVQEDNWTPLMLASGNNNVEMVKFLIGRGAELDIL